jgi:ATP-dependent exoDNAse (exonuclease V) beta subunit
MAREIAVQPVVAAPPARVTDCSQAQQDAAADARAAAHAALSRASWDVTSATADAHHIAAMTRTVLPSPDDPSKVVLPNTPSHRADAGQAWGTLVHGLLEHAMRHADAPREDLLRLGRWLTVEDPKLRDVLSLAVDTVQQVAKAGFWTEAKAAPHSVETPFAFADTPERVMNGVIDLMFERAGQQHVIDYKTDVDPSVYANAYARQLATYGRAIAAVGLAVGEATVHQVRAEGTDVQEQS